MVSVPPGPVKANPQGSYADFESLAFISVAFAELSQLATFGRGRAHLFSNEESTKDRLKDCWYLAVTNEIHYSRQRDPPSIALVHSQGDCVDDGEAPDTWNDIDGVASLRDRLFLQEHEEQLFRCVRNDIHSAPTLF